ncbi:lytic murein transglycosylase [Aliikangiella coralliicola]|uniref:Lytic murein transglycosylase n=1 Tax=Aliikangiella coralliicola TaxID=2592383 RepID=A0A545U0I4_9GAMM|nr:lytic murein transglycosylase [Aliikangiella coralliicola]TQV82979.1 lytic murein transglycosylase [Aliikangiella coralliicola]
MRKTLLLAFSLLVGIQIKADPQKKFEEWKVTLKPEMMQQGASEALVDSIIDSLEYLPKVIRLDRRQPEGTMTHEEYLSKVIPEWKVKKARKQFKVNQDLLKLAEEQTGVEARFITALWGKESNFGTITGNYHVPSALATLAFDGRRKEFFTRELMAATKILGQGHISVENMKGSWAGAMGHCQFMPSSFLTFAKDADGDGKKDIWGNKQDIFVSMGNYLAKSGWQSDKSWGRQVKLTQPFATYQIGKKHKQSLKQWQALGVRRYDLRDLPEVNIDAYLIAPGGEKGRIYLVYQNFDVIMRWNRSHYFATGVGYLADRIGFPKIN